MIRKPAFRPRVEALESRELMAYGVNFDPLTGTVTVGGTTAADMFRIDPIPGTESQVAIGFSSATGDNKLKVFPTADVKKVVVVGRGGDDYLVNLTTIPTTTTTSNGGTINTSLMAGSPRNAAAGQSGVVGVFTAGSTGKVDVDYLYRGAGYTGELGFYVLDGMEGLDPKSAEYRKEAVRRALTNSSLGGVGVSAFSQGARFTGNMPWEGSLNRGTYTGTRSINLAPAARFAAILVPNGRLTTVFNDPNVGGSTAPLFSIPEANPYPLTPQLRGQFGDLDGHGSVFAFEDLRLDGSSDRDYNDLVFQTVGARGVGTPVTDVLNRDRNMYATTVGGQLLGYAAERARNDASTNPSVANQLGSTPAPGVFTVDAGGNVSVDFRYDGGGYAGQVGVFSLEGMGGMAPNSPEFVREATRRAVSGTTLGHLVIDDLGADAAAMTATTWWDKDYNRGIYRGPRTVRMTAGDRIAFVLVPNASLWWAFNNSTTTSINRPLFSFAEANPGAAVQTVDWTGAGNVLGFEDQQAANYGGDREYNDVVFRLTGATGYAPPPELYLAPLKDIRTATFANDVFNG